MARKIFRIDEFFGIDQSRNQNGLSSGVSPDACNMDTADGDLTVAKGYTRYVQTPVPGDGAIHALCFFYGGGVIQPIVCAGSSIYAYKNGAWEEAYTYPEGVIAERFTFLNAQIGGTDHILIACNAAQMVKYNGTSASLFGSAEGASDIHAGFLAMYKSRLFSAGDAAHPNRLYWSQLAGDGRSIEDWSGVEASANVEGGHVEIGAVGGDPITGICAMSNQLLILKQRSLFRLIGDKPSNFIIEELDANIATVMHTPMVKFGDAVYFLTKGGMYCFNGVSAACCDGRRLIKTLASADLSNTCGALTDERLYFSLSDGDGDALIEYDTIRRTFMLRRGFSVGDLSAFMGRLYLINSNRFVYRFNDGESYDGEPISAWWKTPESDAFDKGSVKAMREMYLRGSTQNGAALMADVSVGGNTTTYRLLLPDELHEVLEVPLKNEGRTFSLRFYNEAGGRFTLTGGKVVQTKRLPVQHGQGRRALRCEP